MLWGIGYKLGEFQNDSVMDGCCYYFGMFECYLIYDEKEVGQEFGIYGRVVWCYV